MNKKLLLLPVAVACIGLLIACPSYMEAAPERPIDVIGTVTVRVSEETVPIQYPIVKVGQCEYFVGRGFILSHKGDCHNPIHYCHHLDSTAKQ